MANWLILTACNDFGVPGANLRGCINDILSVYELAKTIYPNVGWKVRALWDRMNTAERARSTIAETIAAANAGDNLWLHNSSHGSFDGEDYLTCAYGFDWNRKKETFVSGRQYYGLLKSAADKGIKVLFTNDACNSGGAIGRDLNGPPRDIQIKSVACPSFAANGNVFTMDKALATLGIAYVSGCGPRATDYSADVVGSDGRAFGAFTKHFLASYTDLRGLNSSHDTIVKDCVSDLSRDQYEQRPELHGGRSSEIMFEGGNA